VQDDRTDKKRRWPSNATLIAIATLLTAIASLVAAFSGDGPS
jgi:hypothetical protein